MLTITVNPSLDLATEIPVLVADRKMHCNQPTTEPGGGGVNVARIAQRLGVEVIALLTSGGGTGAELVQLLEAEGVVVEPVPISGSTRQSVTVAETASGRQFRFVLPGPELTIIDLAALKEHLVAHAGVHAITVLSGSFPRGVSRADAADLALAAAHTCERLIVDTSGDALATLAEIGAFALKPSVNELASWAGHALPTEVEITAAARLLLNSGPNQAVIVSLAAAGALLVERGEPTRRIHAPSVVALSTIGAGDSLVAGIVTTLQRGDDLLQAVRVGVAAGTAAVLRPASQLSQPADIDRLLPLVQVSTFDPEVAAGAFTRPVSPSP